MTKVLVTGGSGFLGRHTLMPLVERGFEVHALYRTSLPTLPTDNVVRWHQCDIFDEAKLGRQIEMIRPEGLLHLAWDTTPGLYWTTSANLDWLAASLHLARCFARCGGQRLVIAGSSAEYQWGGEDKLDEIASPLLPTSLYGKCKNALREVIASWASEENISFAWGRIFNVFGPGEKQARLVPKIIRALMAGNQLPFDSGHSERDFLYVSDAGDAFAALFASDTTGPVNIASGEAVSVREFIMELRDCLQPKGQVLFGALESPSNEPARVVASSARLLNEVGWRAGAPMKMRLQETCAWWRETITRDNGK